MKRFLWPGVLSALAALLTQGAAIQGAAAAEAPLAHKVEMRDRSAEARLVANGGRLIADYGSYRLYATTNLPEQGEGRDDYNQLFLRARTLNTATPEIQALRKGVGSFVGRKLHLVQFAGPPQASWRAALLATGARIVDYIPQNGYLIYGDAAALAAVQRLAATSGARVQWQGEFLDSDKLPAGTRAATAAGRCAIQLVADAAANPATLALLDRLKLAPLDRRETILDYVDIVGRFDPSVLAQIAAQPDVISIQPYGARHKMDERQDQIVAGAVTNGSLLGPGYLEWLQSKGFTQAQFTASGFVVDISDSGIDDGTTRPRHFGLFENGDITSASRVVYVFATGTSHAGHTLAGCDGHGNLNAHIVCGYDDAAGFPFEDELNYHYGLGVCPFVNVGSSVVFDPEIFTNPNYTNLLSTAYKHGARISNNSWGGGDGPQGTEFGVYDIDAQAYDALVRDADPSTAGDQEMTAVFAAGNDGVNTNTFAPVVGTVTSPGTAKNVITVGAAEGVQPFNIDGAPDGSGVYDAEAGNADGMIDFSSKGPCVDGRHKPDLVAPGTHISGGVPQAANPGPDGTALACFLSDNTPPDNGNGGVSGGPITDPDYPFFPDGQEFYTVSSGTSHATPCVSGGCALVRQYFINEGLNPPSPAMTKAFLINSARYLNGPNAGGSLWSDNQGMGEMNLGMAFDGVPRDARDELSEDTFTESGQERTFTGVVADPGKGFRVTVAWTDYPGSTTAAKAYNNNLDLTVSVGGKTYKGNVFNGAYSVPGGSADEADNVESVFLPAGSAGAYTVNIAGTSINSPGRAPKQDFALVIYNAKAADGPVIAAAGAAIGTQSCHPANGVIDPGERVTVSFSLQNTGAAATTNLVATLLTANGVIGPSGPQSYGQLAPGGAAVAEPFTFSADAACGGSIQAVLQLQDGGESLGNVTYNFQLGQLAAQTVFSQNFSGGIPSDWGDSSSIPGDDWTAAADGANGTVAFAADVATTNEADLLSPALALAGTSAQLTFTHRFNLEAPPGAPGIGYDGGVLNIRIGSEPFVDILSAGGSFASNGYNATIIAEGGNPFASSQAWSGQSVGYVTTTVNLPSSAMGQTVSFLWRCGTDVTNSPRDLSGTGGWWIKDVSVTEQQAQCCQSATATSPAILSPVDGAEIAGAAPVVSGSGAPGDTVVLFDNGVSNTVTLVDSNGFFQIPAALEYGTNILTAHQQPANASDSPPVTVIVAPGAPILRASSSSSFPVAVSGQGAPGAVVTIYDSGLALAPGIFVGADGNFSATLDLSFGSHVLTASQTIDGESSASSSAVAVLVVNVPTPVITFPPDGLLTNNGALTIRGTATNGAAVTIYDGGQQIGATTASSAGTFSFAVKLTNGVHELAAAETVNGVAGALSATVSATVQLAPVILTQPESFNSFVGGSATFAAAAYGAPTLRYQWTRNGVNIAGAVRPTLGFASLTAGSAGVYALTVRNGAGVAVSQPATLTLLPNPFPKSATVYQGLFATAPPDFESSGFFNLTLTPVGRFTGKITGGGGAYGFSGAFLVDGTASVTVSRGAKVSALELNLNLNLAGGLMEMGGVVSNVNWSAPLTAYRAVYSTKNPAPEAGNDTAVFGGGYASVAVGKNGYATLHGLLPDNTALVSAAASIATNGQWPLYVPLYGKAGAFFGWIGFTNSGETNFSGAITWARANFFTNALALAGSPLNARSPFLGATNLEVFLSGGDLPDGQTLSNSVTLLKSGVLKAAAGGSIPGLSLSANLTSGAVSGRFANPVTHAAETIHAILFQAATNASGFFRDANGSGTFLLTPAPSP